MASVSPPGLRAQTRDALQARVVALLRQHGRLSRAELAERLCLPKSTLTGAIAHLLAAGVLVEHGAHAGGPGSGSGRPSRLLGIAAPPGVVAGFDFGHRHVRVALATGECTILGEADTEEQDVDQHASGAFDAAAALLHQLQDATGTTLADIRAAAAGIPGPIDATTRRVQSPTILAGWVGIDISGELHRRTGLQVHLDNDANLGALGELSRGAGRTYRNYLYVKASDGIGACLMIDGVPYRGAGGTAGEIGHTQLDPDGPWCRCGNRGCLETIVSIDMARQHLAPLGLDPLDPDDATHPVARKLLAEAGRAVGHVLANLCNALDPAAVIVGGDLAATGTAFIDGIRDSIDRFALPTAGRAVDVRTAGLGRRAELLGALTLAIASMEQAAAAS